MKTSEKIIAYVRKNGQVTGSELVEHLNITDRAVRKQLKALLDEGRLTKAGKPPRVYYSLKNPVDSIVTVSTDLPVDDQIKKLIEEKFLYITPLGTTQSGWNGFVYWCRARKLDPIKSAARYQEIDKKYDHYKKAGIIDGMYKMKSSFPDVALDRIFYIDFYSTEIFGKTKLGQLLLFAKQSQDRQLINEIAHQIKPTVVGLVEKYQIDGVGFIPPTVKRQLQLMKQIQKTLDLHVRALSITKVKTPVAVPQKTLSKIEDRIINARETMSVDGIGSYNNILLIDDAVGSGATLNETAKKIRQKGLCKGQVIGLAITGSFKGFDVISEI